MAEELTPPTVNRRGVLKTLGAGVAVSTFANTTAAESEYDRVVDIVEAGADNTGAEPIDDVFSDVARDDTLVKFPAGRYKISHITVYGLTNFGMVGTDDTVLFPSEEYDPKLWIAGTNNRDLRFENFTIDNTEDGYGPTLNLHVYDGLVVRNVTKIGYHDVDRPGFGFRIIEDGGTGIVENLQAADGGTSVGIYTDPNGPLIYRNCHIEGFANNGLYGVYGDGPIHIEGGLYKNNNVTSLRLSNPESSVTGATVVVDDPPEEFGDCRGIRISDGPGPVRIRDCEIRMEDGHGTGGIVCEGTGGSFSVENTAIGIGEDYTIGPDTDRTSYAIYVDPATDAEVGRRTIENTVIRGGGNDLAAVRMYRDGNAFRNVCIDQWGTERSGILFVDCQDNVVEESAITVPGEQIRLDGDSTADVSDLSTGVNCAWPSDDAVFGGETITISGDGETAHYEFSVEGNVRKSTANGGVINDFDTVHEDGRVTGRTTSQPDSYEFTGEILDFTVDAPVAVSIGGEPVDPSSLGSDIVTLVGDGETVHYELTVDGDVEKSTAYDATINAYDEITDDGRVTGRTTNDPDSFRVSGDITGFETDGDVTVRYNGQEILPELLGTYSVTISGQGTTANYEFVVDGAVQKATTYGGTINEYDTIHYGGRVTGRTTDEPDTFRCSGVLHSFEVDEPVNVTVDGESVDME